MSIIKWLQLSDVHFGSPDALVTETVREYFLEKCRQLHGIDYLFITGDLRYSKLHPDKYPKGTIEFIKNVQISLNVVPNNTFMVPGNHDIERNATLEATIKEIRKEYWQTRTIPPEYMQFLESSRQQYLDLYEQVCGKSMVKNHFFIDKGDINIIHIDTAILCGKDGEDGSLLIDMLALRKALDGIDKKKPAIALAHHTFDCLDDIEQEQLELLLKQFNTILYLCGHKHFTRCKNIQIRKPNINLWEYVCGTNIDSPTKEWPVEIDFFTGEINTELKTGYVESHKWSQSNNAWLPNSEFSFPQNGIYDGKYYFPEREITSSDYYDNDRGEEARNEYREYLKPECGEIRLDDLPFDKEVGSKTVLLERLFVPRIFSGYSESQFTWDENDSLFKPNSVERIIPNEGIIRLAIFSGPGGGKTTWMKRLASAYGIGNREDVRDQLPKRSLFPIWIKCRQFKEGTPLSILEIIYEIPERAGFAKKEHLQSAFFELACNHIQNGTALVLVDGLDEIGDESNRLEFISKLNRFVEMNKKVNIVITSRSVGYELVSRNLKLDFDRYKIKSFQPDDIISLCIGWHKIFYGDREEIVEEAKKLGSTIIENEKIRKLAQTPVLLTTLLLIKRRVGQLPTKRAALYREAIKVLLDSWGADVHLPIGIDDALPQLAYLAHYMIFIKPQQIIGKTELEQVLLQARIDIPELSATSETVQQFIQRVEYRSELLVQRGYRQVDKDSGRIEAVYEFSHLTFQEYLAACAVVKKYYPQATRESRINECFNGFFEDEAMREVILLAAVQTDRWGAEDIAQALLSRLSYNRGLRHINRQKNIKHIINLLMQMIADESPLTYNMREAIYKECFDSSIAKGSIDGIIAVYSSKYGKELQNVLEPLDESRHIKVFIPLFKLIELRKEPNFSVYRYWGENKDSEKALTLGILNIAAWLGSDWQGKDSKNIENIKDDLVKLYENDNEQIAIFAFCTLDSLCQDKDNIFSGKLLYRLLKLSEIWEEGMSMTYKFPITIDTVLYLQSISLSSMQKLNLEERMNKENNTYDLLGYFWFGVLFKAWDLQTVIQMAKEYLSSDYIDESDSEKLRVRMLSYLYVLQEANAILPENENLVKEFIEYIEEFYLELLRQGEQ